MSERARLATSCEQSPGPWKRWGAYLSERQWGTVREDYSAKGEAWSYFPHDHARSRAYRWGEDGLAGYSDNAQRLCLALALWNGRDPILKERLFGLNNDEGNHGEDVKEYWWYVDATPTHSWLTWRYHYPQREFPYEDLVAESRRRTRHDPEYELLDTGVFDDDRYWIVTVEYAKASPEDTCMRITVENVGPDEATLHVLPTLWYRNTWAWEPGAGRPQLRCDGRRIVGDDGMSLVCDGTPRLLACDNDTNDRRLYGHAGAPYPKDAINDTVVSGTDVTNPAGTGTKAAAWYTLTVPSGGHAVVRCRLTEAADIGSDFDDVFATRQAEADEFHAALVGDRNLSDDERAIVRQAAAGIIWSQQFFHTDVARWLDGDPAQPPPPAERHQRRNSRWRHLNAADVMPVPDPWEYPWFASWDHAFQCVVLAHIDPELAKHQLVLLCREWMMHPNGQLPAYEWDYGDVNPPVHAWAALRVFEVDGRRDYVFLERVFQKLLLNFTWWVNKADREGDNVYEGGFLGLDNIGPFDRSKPIPLYGLLEQADATAWMAMYCLNLLEIALTLAAHDRAHEDIATKFFEHFAYISTALNTLGLWDDIDGFYYDVVREPDGRRLPIRSRSVVGLVPLFGVMCIDGDVLTRLDRFRDRARWFMEHKPEYCGSVAETMAYLVPGRAEPLVLSVAGADRVRRILARVLDPQEFLSDHGIRGLSRYHREHPLVLPVEGGNARVDYEPAESQSWLFGGNSNWRGPVWLPINSLAVEALRRLHQGFGAGYTVRHPNVEGGELRTLDEVADDLADRLVKLYRRDADGRRAAYGGVERLQRDARWSEHLLFYEYFNGDDGAGLGASHQTGWTALLLDLLLRR